MANIVIVTKQCYLLCQSINFIKTQKVSNEEKKDDLFKSLPSRKRKLTARQRAQLKKDRDDVWEITIDFITTPILNGLNNANRNSSENHSICVTVIGKDKCQGLFEDMVNQIREQLPDQLFLDKMVEKFFTNNPRDGHVD